MRLSSISKSRTRLAAPGVTLVEVLVVIAVIGMLMAICFPAFARVREAARQTVCSVRLSQTAMLLRLYASDYSEQFPRVQDAAYGLVQPSFDPATSLEKTWVDLLTEHRYIDADLGLGGVPQTLMCPSAQGYDNDPTWAGHMPHFGVNVNLSPPRRLDAIAGRRSFFGRPFDFSGDQSQKIMMAESTHLTNPRGWFSVGNINWIGARHGPMRSANVAYLDGHVKLRFATSSTESTGPTAPFAGESFWRQSLP